MNKVYFTKSALTAAIGAILLSACAGAPTQQATQSTAIPAAGHNLQMPQYVQNTHAEVGAKNTVSATNTEINGTAIFDNGMYYNDDYLDAETLDILEDLLEARDMTMVEGDRLTVERYGDLWDRVRTGYKIAQPAQNIRIDAQKNWFSARQSYLDRLTARASRYLHYTVTEAERRGLPTELALLPIIESSYDPSATSNASAAGLWQFIPSTGRIYGLNQTSAYDGRRDIIESTRAAYDFLTTLYNQFGSWELALASYNAGPGRIQRAIDANAAQGLPTDYWSLKLPTETMNYVPRFMAVSQIVANPYAHGVSLPAIANHTHFRTAATAYNVSLYDIAAVTGVSVEELQLLNPALINLRVDSAGANRVVIPNSLPYHIDSTLAALGGGVIQAPVQNTDYVALNYQSVPKQNQDSSAQTLKAVSALPTTASGVTNNRTVIQEPPLTQEEIAFIAEQIRLSTPEPVNPISQNDGNIEIDAIQTSQSVLDARGQKKSLRYAPSPASKAPSVSASTSAKSANKSTAKPKPTGVKSSYTVKKGDTLIGIADAHGVSLASLTEWNDLDASANLLVGTKLDLYGATTKIPAKSSETKTEQSKTYTVRSGDTLTGVAAKFNLSPAQLAKYNGIEATAHLLQGQKLWLDDSKPAQKGGKTAATQTYKVKAGDSLSAIAANFGISIQDITALNDFDQSAKLLVNQSINLPKNAAAKTASSDTNTAKSSNTSSDKADVNVYKHTDSYTVQAGDTLTGVAAKFATNISDLARANNITTKTRLQANQKLIVPKISISYTVKSGDTLIGLAKKYGISTEALADMNNIKSTDGLKRGQKLNVPAN